MSDVVTANKAGRREALVALAETLAEAIDGYSDEKLLPQLARQYRETLKDLAAIEQPSDDSIDGLIGDLSHVR